MLPLTKTLDLADFDQLGEELTLVDKYFTKDREQHPMRRWEYAMALQAFDRWLTARGVQKGWTARSIVDVGGAGSPFWRMVGDQTVVIDPDGGQSLAEYLGTAPLLAQAVFCLSVLEHVDDLDQFLYHLNCLVAPGGLLFLTVDCCDCEQSGDWRLRHVLPDDEDKHHFHWMRKRMFTRSSWEYLALNLRPYGFELFETQDWFYRGNHVYDYTFASLALIKRS